VKWSGIRLAQARQGINRVSPPSVNRLKEPQDFVRFDSFLERFQLLRALPQLDIFDVNGAVLMHREHQSLDAAFAGVVVFHLGDGNGEPFRHVPAAVRQDTEVHIRLVDHAQ
jgi:hypothetical protein